MTEIEKRIKAEAHLMMIPQQIRPIDKETLPKQHYFMSSGGITQTKKGRLWIMWAGGGDNWDAHLLFAYSDDNGEHFTEPRFLLTGPKTPSGLNTCIIEGNLFCAPDGALHVFYCQRLGFLDGRCGAWHTVCRNPDEANPVWETPVRIADGSVLDKPIILQDGRWLLEISIWPKGRLVLGPGANNWQDYSELWEGELSAPRGANIYISSDEGKSWQYQGSCYPSDRECDEPRVIQRKDGSLLMLLRNQKGLVWSESFDMGKTWTASVPTTFPAPTSRTALLRLPDGRMLLIRNVPTEKTVKQMKPERVWTDGREQLTAFVSEDEGKTWSSGVRIDSRQGVSYPDAIVTKDGSIHVLYDWRRTNGELMYARFSVADLDAGRSIVTRVLYSGHENGNKCEAIGNVKKKMESIHGESCMFVGSGRTRLLFEPESVIKVYNSVTGMTYEEGKDYLLDLPNRSIIRTENSRIPLLSIEDMHPIEDVRYYPHPEANAVAGEGKSIRFDAKLFFAEHQIEVDYTTCKHWALLDTKNIIKRISRITATGDSITEGYNASAYIGRAPFRKAYPGQVAEALNASLTNLGVNGSSVRMLRQIIDKIVESKPDLLTIAFGMNDLRNLSPEQFIAEIDNAVKSIRAALPETFIVLVSPMSGNPEWQCTPIANTAAFSVALKQYAQKENVIFADVFKEWSFVLERKDFFSLTGNGVNHPNDFGHWIYAQTILSAIASSIK